MSMTMSSQHMMRFQYLPRNPFLQQPGQLGMVGALLPSVSLQCHCSSRSSRCPSQYYSTAVLQEPRPS
jgi:hypothetical protein